MLPKVLSVTIALLFSMRAQAVDLPAEPTFTATAKNTFTPSTLGRDFISPFTTDAKYPLLIGASVTGLVMAIKKNVEEPVNDDFETRRPLGHSKFGDVAGQLLPNVAYFGTQLALYGIVSDPSARSTALRRADLMFRSTLHASVMTLALKSIFREGRPYNNNEKTSFPSGHATSTFAFASAVAMEHEWYWGLGAYSLATYVGLSRVNDHQHHLRDVLAGATIGISYGMGIYYRMNETHSTDSTSTAADQNINSSSLIAVLPTDDLAGAAFIFRRAF